MIIRSFILAFFYAYAAALCASTRSRTVYNGCPEFTCNCHGATSFLFRFSLLILRPKHVRGLYILCLGFLGPAAKQDNQFVTLLPK